MSYQPQPRLPLAPLLRLIHAGRYEAGRTEHTGITDAIVVATGMSRRVAIRYSQEGALPERWCDRAAANLGMHPINIWPEWETLASIPACDFEDDSVPAVT